MVLSKKYEGKRAGRKTRLKFFFYINKCKSCPFHNEYFKEEAKSTTYSITVKSINRYNQEAFRETESVKTPAENYFRIEKNNRPNIDTGMK